MVVIDCFLICFPSFQKMAEIASVETCIDDGKIIVTVLDEVKKTLLDPILGAIQKEINNINATIDGLEADAKEKVRDAFKKLLDCENCILYNRRVLMELANDTISRSRDWKQYLELLEDEDSVSDEEALTETLDTAEEDFISLQNRVKEQLEEAKKSYEEALDNLTIVKADLKCFVDAVKALEAHAYADGGYANTLRKQVYRSMTATVIGRPIAMAIGYEIAAAIVEVKISEWERAIKKLKESCNKAVVASEKILADWF